MVKQHIENHANYPSFQIYIKKRAFRENIISTAKKTTLFTFQYGIHPGK